MEALLKTRGVSQATLERMVSEFSTEQLEQLETCLIRMLHTVKGRRVARMSDASVQKQGLPKRRLQRKRPRLLLAPPPAKAQQEETPFAKYSVLPPFP